MQYIKKRLSWVRIFVIKHKRILLIALGAFLALIVVAQFVYPTSRLAPFARVDGVAMGGWEKKDAAWELDARYEQTTIPLFFGENTQPYDSLQPVEIGLQVSNQERADALDYPWYMRLIPGSIAWYGLIQPEGVPAYNRDEEATQAYISDEFGESCSVDPVNATLRVNEGLVEAVPSQDGGTCAVSDIATELLGATPLLGETNALRVPVVPIPAEISDDEAEQQAALINQRLQADIPIAAGDELVQIAPNTVASWLTFDTEGDEIVVTIDAAKAKTTLNELVAPKVSRTAGVSKVTTRDFVEISRVDGARGVALDISATGAAIAGYLTGQNQEVVAQTVSTAPRVEYTRSYSPTDVGLSALMKNYANDNPGSYAVQLIELSGERRRASFDEGKAWTPASTYKLFVAYSTLKEVESGAWKWSDEIVPGRDLSTCFDDMISRSDNPCAEALLKKVGFQQITNDARSIGATTTSFLGSDGIKTSAADLALLLASLKSGQLLEKQSSRDRFLSALSGNIFRQGIPAGVSGSVANKVGFLDDYLNDAAIVTGSSGTYVLVILTKGSSWANIAELAKQLQELRAQ